MNWETVLKAGMPKRYARIIEVIMSDGKKRTGAQVHDDVKNYFLDNKARDFRTLRNLPQISQFHSYMSRMSKMGVYQVSGKRVKEYQLVREEE